MPWIITLRGKPVAFVDLEKNRIVIDVGVAPALEPCLLAYGISVALGDEEKVDNPRITGFTASVVKELTEDQVVKAIMRCIGFVYGARAEAEPVEKVYVLEPKQIIEEVLDETSEPPADGGE